MDMRQNFCTGETICIYTKGKTVEAVIRKQWTSSDGFFIVGLISRVFDPISTTKKYEELLFDLRKIPKDTPIEPFVLESLTLFLTYLFSENLIRKFTVIGNLWDAELYQLSGDFIKAQFDISSGVDMCLHKNEDKGNNTIIFELIKNGV